MKYLAAHLAGDFLLQNDWMQGKTKSWWPCLVHVATYMLPWLVVGLSWQALLIAVEHGVQDRYRLGGVWTKVYRQTPPEKWPQGPLWVDQSLHAVWIALVVALVG